MAKQNRTVLKGYFETGDTPNQQNYADFIDSKINLSETNVGNLSLTGNITSSGIISASGYVYADRFIVDTQATIDTNSDGNLLTNTGIKITGPVTMSGGLLFLNLPTTDPSVAGAAYNDSGTLKISTGS